MNNEQQENIQSLDPKQYDIDCSMNSLVSSANSTYICGLDRKVDKVLGSSTQTKRKLNYSIESSNQTKKVNYSITNCSPPGPTPPVYTLNNTNKVATQLPAHSGPKYDLSENTWQVIMKTKGITKLHNWQEDRLNKALQTDSNFTYSVPTSGGKTCYLNRSRFVHPATSGDDQSLSEDWLCPPVSATSCFPEPGRCPPA